MLKVRDLKAGYGAAPVLFGVDLDIGAGEVVALMGRNGMGKTTTIKSIIGLVPPSSGSVKFKDRELAGAPPFKIAAAGIGLVPEGRQIFPRLSVEENLLATERSGGPWTLDAIYKLFPSLEARRAHGGDKISGGEQQMLAIGRALMTNPELLILDEATEGLAPLLRAQIWQSLEQLKQSGLAILIVDKNIGPLMKIATRFAVLEKGVVVWTGTAADFAADRSVVDKYLAV